jgi:hypothetical protein
VDREWTPYYGRLPKKLHKAPLGGTQGSTSEQCTKAPSQQQGLILANTGLLAGASLWRSQKWSNNAVEVKVILPMLCMQHPSSLFLVIAAHLAPVGPNSGFGPVMGLAVLG